MKRPIEFWARIALINLAIVAFLGTLMRYKIGFTFPFFSQKYLQEAHSHFAFTGWITHCLFILVILLFRTHLSPLREKTYGVLIILNLLFAYGMLASFPFQGYGPVSLFFSTGSLVTGYVFSFFAFKDASRLPSDHPSKNWIKAAVVLGVLSTLGTIVLSHMMATRQYDQTTYLGSIYFYLHFQYNGWFLFACIGLFLDQIKHYALHLRNARYAFWLFFLSAIPAYFLSTLWADLPVWLYIIVVVAAVLQVVGWIYFIRILRAHIPDLRREFSKPILALFLVVASAMTLKLLLQLGSIVPAISDLAFGFRPIVIAYLHLVLLLIVSLFLIVYMYSSGILKQNRMSLLSIIVFAAAAILNEVVLSAQGIVGLSYIVIPWVNEILFGIASILFLSSFLLMIIQYYSVRH